MRCKGQAPWSSRWDPRCGMVGAPCDVMFGAHRVSGWGPSGVLGWSLWAVLTMSSALVDTLDRSRRRNERTISTIWPTAKPRAVRPA